MIAVTRKQKEDYMQSLEEMTRKRGQWRDVLHRLFKNKLAVFGLILVAIVLFGVIFANFLTPYDYSAQDFSNRFTYPCLAHPLGTDNFGRDLLARILYGGRVSLVVALIAVAIALVLGGLLGAVAGYFGGWVDTIIMRVIDILMAIPGMLLAVAISAALGTGVVNTGIAVGLSSIPGGARILRSTVLTIRNEQYITAARSCGASHTRIIFKHVLPNTIAPLIVDASMKIGMAILTISSLSFVGLGVHEPTPEWGAILNSGRAYIRDFWPMVIFPGLVIMITLLGFNLLGDGLRDALDPKLKQ
jgi:peptide/nickel transport system permease protein